MPDQILKQHYLELDDNKKIVKIAPLMEEIPGTSFFNGILFPSLKKTDTQSLITLSEQNNYKSIADLLFKSGMIAPTTEFPVFIYQLTGTDLSSSEFGTSDSCRNCHIQRL